ncbi:hypothetical protein, partial [Enterococcus faecalis]|uniref:hypothetical protein n=1 Tax=Enterococcus faecalis TaxID=1351 RepID=UPI003D6C2AF6
AQCGISKTILEPNSLSHRTRWLRFDLVLLLVMLGIVGMSKVLAGSDYKYGCRILVANFIVVGSQAVLLRQDLITTP